MSLKKKLSDQGKLSKEDMMKLVKVEDELMEMLRRGIADIEAKDPPLSMEDQLKLA